MGARGDFYRVEEEGEGAPKAVGEGFRRWPPSMVVEPVERRFREGEGRGGGAGTFKAHLWREGKWHGRGEWRQGGSARPAMARAGEAEGRGWWEVREESDGWAPSVGEREREGERRRD
jgi:hypothetical protein